MKTKDKTLKLQLFQSILTCSYNPESALEATKAVWEWIEPKKEPKDPPTQKIKGPIYEKVKKGKFTDEPSKEIPVWDGKPETLGGNGSFSGSGANSGLAGSTCNYTTLKPSDNITLTSVEDHLVWVNPEPNDVQ